ncbi:MAG: hypothetical protein PF508_12005 [Spirochaeta sp.]|jgi:hypothetical protein|nr:hypothetical protein [Spirochaeta sp.]
MDQLEQSFLDLRRALTHRSLLVDQGEDPVFFLVYDPKDSLGMYQRMGDLVTVLRHDGWVPRAFDLGDRLERHITEHEDYEFIREGLRDDPDDEEIVADVYQSVRQLLHDGPDATIVEGWVTAEIEAAAAEPNGLLLVYGLELLHPYLQIGYVEQKIQGHVTCPVVVLYPGKRTSAFGLRYLGFYPPDGNYRSRHVGGNVG